jgi:hypothetical protein
MSTVSFDEITSAKSIAFGAKDQHNQEIAPTTRRKSTQGEKRKKMKDQSEV